LAMVVEMRETKTNELHPPNRRISLASTSWCKSGPRDRDAKPMRSWWASRGHRTNVGSPLLRSHHLRGPY
jgi:hypothetical protein